MQVLARQVDALDAAGPAFERDGEAARLRLLDGSFGVDEPLLVERSESRAVERRREGREGHLRSAGIGESAALAEHLVDDVPTYLQWRGEVLARSVEIRMTSLHQGLGEQQADGPVRERLEQGDVPEQEQAEVPGRGSVHQVQEDRPITELRMDADGQFVREVAVRCLLTGAESDARKLLPRQRVAERTHEEPALVCAWPDPRLRAVVQHRVEQHHALDHPARRGALAEATVRVLDHRPQRLVVQVEHAPPMQLAGGDRRRQPAVDERLDEVGGLLPVGDAGELAVLPLEEDAGMQEHLQQEPRLSVGEAEGGDGLKPRGIGVREPPALWRRRERHGRQGRHRHRSSSTSPRPRRPLPPPHPPTLQPDDA